MNSYVDDFYLNLLRRRFCFKSRKIRETPHKKNYVFPIIPREIILEVEEFEIKVSDKTITQKLC